jgi:hypothetical protein
MAATASVAPSGTLEAAPGCSTTAANGATPPGETQMATHHGRDGLWTVFNKEGVLRINPTPPTRPGETFGRTYADGSLDTKFPWWGSRRASARLVIRGQRLDGSARAFVKKYRAHPGATRAPYFWATRLRFGTPGCWRVTGRAGGARLSFVLLVQPVASN